MRKYLHIILLAVVIASCGPRVIPRGKMADIYYDMFMADQLLREDMDLRRQADTLLVYEAVFNRYGYNTDDYLYSLRYYLKDPERFAQVLHEVVERLQKDAESMDPVIEHLDWVNKYTGIEGGATIDSILQRFNVDTLDGKIHFYMDSSWFSSRYRMVSVPADTSKKAPADSSVEARVDSLRAPVDTLRKPLKPLPLPHPVGGPGGMVEEVEEAVEMEEAVRE